MTKLSFKKRLFQSYLRNREKVRRAVEYIFNINIDIIFWFALSYLILPHISLFTRIVGMIGWTYIYRLIVKDVHTYAIYRSTKR